MKRVGLTGAAGCGKSTVLKMFRELGWNAVDTDAICGALHGNPESGIQPLLRERWGDRALAPDGTTEKRTVADIVFADEKERKWLERIVHPFIRQEVERQIAHFSEDACVMVDVPLLFECGWEKELEATIAVWASPGVQMERLLARGWSRTHAEFRIASQLSADRKLELADYGIINDSDLETLKKQCMELNRHLNS